MIVLQLKKVNRTTRELINANSSLSHYLDSLQRGRNATPHSWLYEGEDSHTTLDKWLNLLTSANKTSKFGKIFDQFDQGQISKFGPQGLVPPLSDKASIEVIEPLYSPSEFDDEMKLSHLFNDAAKFAREAFGAKVLRQRPKCFESVIVDMRARDTLTTNSGFPAFTRRSMVTNQEVQDARLGVAYDYPAILLFRQYNGKLRPVWMFPMSLNLIEFSFAQPLQEALQNSDEEWIRNYLSPWKGFEFVKLTLTRQWHGQNIDGGDTTKMDANMRPAQLRLVYEIVKHLFQEQYWNDLYKSLMHVNTIKMLVSREQWYVGTHGLASGSGWTQLTETVLQLFMSWRIKAHGQGIGDDFYWLSNMSAQELVTYLGEYGLPANVDKQTVSSTELHFLQRLFIKDFFSREDRSTLGGYYPTVRALNSLLHPERMVKPKDWNSDMFCIRCYMILENCVDNPCFPDFVNFVVHGQKDLIPFAKKSAHAIDAAWKRSKLVPGLSPTYNQEKREKPLSSFVSIELARDL